MGAALGRAFGKTFLGRGLVKAGSKGAKGFKMPRMSVGAMRWAGTGSYRALAEGAGESSASAVGRGAATGARAMRVPRFRATARQAAQAGEEGIEMSTLRSGGRALAQPVGLVSRTTGQSAVGRVGSAMRGAIGRGRLPNRGVVGAGLGAVAATTIGVGASMRPDSNQDLRVNKLPRAGGGGVESEVPETPSGGGDEKPEDRPPPRKHPQNVPTNPNVPTGPRTDLPPKAGRNPGIPVTPKPGRNPATPVTPKPGRKPATPVTPKPGRNPATPVTPKPGRNPATPVTPKPGRNPPMQGPSQPRPTRPSQRQPTLGEIRGSLLAPSGAYVRGKMVPPRGQRPAPGGLTNDQIRGSMLRLRSGDRSRRPIRLNLADIRTRGTIGGSYEQQRALYNAMYRFNRLPQGNYIP